MVAVWQLLVVSLSRPPFMKLHRLRSRKNTLTKLDLLAFVVGAFSALTLIFGPPSKQSLLMIGAWILLLVLMRIADPYLRAWVARKRGDGRGEDLPDND